MLVTAASAAMTRPTRAAADSQWRARWQAHEPGSTRTIDHAALGTLLERYLEVRPQGVNRFGYAAVTQGDRDALRRYLDGLSATRIAQYGRAEQFAFWANLYNALTLDVVLAHWPVDSIRDIDISPGWFADGPWGKPLIEVEGVELSLDDIEHEILRPIWRDPRIHYAVNCASIGCPELKPEPFRGDRLDAQLEAAARDYVNHPRGAKVSDGRLIVSSIYEWYREDFGGDDAGVIAHLRRYARPALQESLAGVSRIADDHYDWSINAP